MRRVLGTVRLLAFAGALVMLMGALRPRPQGPPEDGAHAAARTMVNQVIQALEAVRGDVGEDALRDRLPDVGFLAGDGPLPAELTGAAGIVPLTDLLQDDRFGLDGWRGPYLGVVGADPWGTAYVVTFGGIRDWKTRVWVVSAGPNGRLETREPDAMPQGDDVALIAYW